MTTTLIAAIARNGVIGAGGTIPWHLPADLRRFKETTMGSVLVMGRRTYESIGRPLPGRTTIVVTSHEAWPGDQDRAAGLRVARSVSEALDQGADIADRTFVAGGARVYADAVPLADRMLITWVDAEPAGDTYFPDLDWSQWAEIDVEPFDGGRWSSYVRSTGGRRKQ